MNEATIMEEAADWLQRLQSRPNDEKVLAEWLDWCRARPGNLEAFERLQAVWQAFDIPEIANAADAMRRSHGGRNVSTAGLHDEETHTADPHLNWDGRARNALVGTLAASVLLAGGVVLWRFAESNRAQGHTLTTAVAEHGSQILADGSQVDLGAKTRIVTRYMSAERSVVIDAGEAFFKVQKDTRRPFVVNAGTLRVTAVGTAFSVRRGVDRITVTVSEGVVRIGPDAGEYTGHEVRAGAGEQVTFTESSSSLTIARVDPSAATSWREGVLKFMDEPLGSVVSSVNRYSARQIVIEDPDLAARPFTGTVYEGRIDDWLHALERVFPLEVTDERGAAIRLERRKE